MASQHCEFITQHGKECTVKKRGADCPPGFFYCKNHLTYRSVKDRLAGVNQQAPVVQKKSNIKSKTTVSATNFKNPKKSVKLVNDSSDDISNIFNADQAKESIFKILGNSKEANKENNENNSLRKNSSNEDPISILKNILNDEDDGETLSKKQLSSKKIVDRALANSQKFDIPDDDEDADANEDGEQIPERRISKLSISSLLESSYWITMTAVEQRSLKLKGLNDRLRSNEPLLDNLELAFKEILLFMGLEEDLGVESPCMIVLLATGQVIINTLILNGGLDDLISKFFKKKENNEEDSEQDQRSNRIIIDSQNYADIF